jgi:hypothetical protein
MATTTMMMMRETLFLLISASVGEKNHLDIQIPFIIYLCHGGREASLSRFFFGIEKKRQFCIFQKKREGGRKKWQGNLST